MSLVRIWIGLIRLCVWSFCFLYWEYLHTILAISFADILFWKLKLLLVPLFIVRYNLYLRWGCLWWNHANIYHSLSYHLYKTKKITSFFPFNVREILRRRWKQYKPLLRYWLNSFIYFLNMMQYWAIIEWGHYQMMFIMQ